MNTSPRFPIGLTFDHYAVKHNKQRTIMDILTTRNAKNEVIRIDYECEYQFMGNALTSLLCDTTIARCLNEEQRQQYIDAPLPKSELE